MKTRLFFCFIVFSLCFGIKNARATTYTWIGGTSTSWTNPLNWGVLSGYPGSGTGDIAIFPLIYLSSPTLSGNLPNSLSSIQSASLANVAITINSGVTLNTGGITTGNNYLGVAGITFLGGGTINISGTTSFTYQGSLTFGSSSGSTQPTVNYAAGSVINYNSNSGTITNYGTLNFNGTSSSGITVNFVYLGSFTNSGTITATYTGFLIPSASSTNVTITNSGSFSITSSTIGLTSQPSVLNNSGTFTATSSTFNLSKNNTTISNTNTFTATSSTFNLTGQSAAISNSGSTAAVSLSQCAVNMNSSNTVNITNSTNATFTINNSSTITMSGYQNYISNAGIFKAGTSGSPCVITISGQGASSGNTSIVNTGTFTLGSTSIIYPNGTDSTNPIKITNSSGTFTLQSDANGSAAIGNVGVGSFLVGLFNTERFITGGSLASNRGYRMLSSPVNQTSATSALTNTFGLTYLKDHTFNGITYTGAYTGGVAGTAAGFSITSVGPTVSIWDERKATNNTAYNAGRNIGVTKISPTNGVFVTATTNTIDISDGTTNLALPVGNSFQLFFIGPSSRTNASASTPPADATITAHGYINQQNVTVALWHAPTGGVSGKLSYTAALGTTMAGINMVGNPYASTINLQTVLTDNTGNIDNIYVLAAKNYPSQAFIAYTPSGTSAPMQGYAVSGEGFFVHATGTGKSLTFKEGEKTPTTQLTGTGLIMSAPKSGQIVANEPGAMSKSFKTLAVNTATQAIDAGLTGFYMKMEKDTAVYNYCGIYFGGQWSKNFQIGDARDLDGNSPQVMMSSFSADRVRCAVKHFPDYRQGVRVKLFANGKTDGMYTLKIEGIRNIDTNNYKITLLDHFKKDSLDIGRYKSYAFNIARSDTNTFGANRFELTIQQLPASKYQLATFTAQKATDGVLLTWRAYNEGPNYFFTLEKQQTSGKDYSSVYHTQSNGRTIYKYTDKTPNTGDNVYRLKQVDLFGNITYSGPVNIYYDKSGSNNMFTVYPNPTAETLNVNVTFGKTITAPQTYKLNIYDATGSLVMQKISDNTNWNENVSKFNPGVYIVELKDNSGSSLGKVKFVKK